MERLGAAQRVLNGTATNLLAALLRFEEESGLIVDSVSLQRVSTVTHERQPHSLLVGITIEAKMEGNST